MMLNHKIGYGAVAAAVALACGSAGAATLTSAGGNWSLQGNTNSTTAETTSVLVTVTVGANYIQNDTAQLTIAGANFPTSGSPADVTCSGGAVFGALGYNTAGTTASYRVTSATGPTNNSSCVFTVAVRNRTASTAGNVSVSWSAQTASSGLSFDAGAAATVATVRDQFVGAVATSGGLNGIVDVNTGRYHFTTDDAANVITTGNEDTLTLSFTNNSTDTNPATVSSIVASITGDFTFLDDDGTAGCVSGDITGGRGIAATSTGGTLGIDASCSTLTYTTTSSGTHVIALGKNVASTTSPSTTEKTLTAPQTFSGSVVFSYGRSGTLTTDSDTVAPGAWTLNGASIDVAFMPYTEGTSRILNLTNRSSQTGAISVSARNESGTSCPAFSAGTIGGNSILNISAAVDAGIRNCYGASFAGRVYLTVTANIPGASAELYSGYNRNGSLSTIVNTSNGK